MDQWNSALLRNGFNGVEVSANDYDDLAHRSAMLVSRANSQGAVSTTRPVVFVQDAAVPSTLSKISDSLEGVFQINGFQSSVTHWSSLQPKENSIYVILDNVEKPLLLTQIPDRFSQVTRLFTQCRNIIWITFQDQSQVQKELKPTLVDGFIRTARTETDSSKFVTIQVYDNVMDHLSEFCRKTFKVIFKSTCCPDTDLATEVEYAYEQGVFLVPRLIPSEHLNSLASGEIKRPLIELGLLRQGNRHLKLHLEEPGILESLRFVDDGTSQRVLAPHDIEVQVEACSLGASDALMILGKENGSLAVYGECAGVVTRVGTELGARYKSGDRVIAWGGMMYSNIVRTNCSSIHHLPTNMSFTIGSALPAAFGAVYFALVEVARVQNGQKLFINMAASYVGQVALEIAKYLGLSIFATVKGDDERHYLLERFHLRHDHIFSCTSRSLEKSFFEITGGEGVDVFLNIPSGGPFLDKTAFVAKFGYLIDIGNEKDLWSDESNKKLRANGINYSSVDFRLLCEYQPERVSRVLSKAISLFGTGLLKPIEPTEVMPISSISSAVRRIENCITGDKIILEFKEDAMVPVETVAAASTTFSPNATYLVAGGLGGLGRAIACMMASKGAKNIVTLSRRSLNAQECEIRRDELRRLGAEAKFITCDITDRRQVERLSSDQLCGMPLVKGIVQSAAVVRVGIAKLSR